MTIYADRETRETPRARSSDSAPNQSHYLNTVKDGRWTIRKLYANPVPSVPEIEYSVLYEFAERKRCSYNDLCKAVREAVEAPIRVRTMLAAAKEES